MVSIRIMAISSDIAAAVRATGKSPIYNHPVNQEIATGHGPCRHCLRTFRIGHEQRTLFTYNPFLGPLAIPLPGPVFIHSDLCERYHEDAGYPPDLQTYTTVLDAHNDVGDLVAQIKAPAGEAELHIERLFADSAVHCIHVRDREAGCFDFRVERRP